MGSDSKSKKKGEAAKDDKSVKSGKSKSKQKQAPKSPSKSPSKKQKEAKPKKAGSKAKKDDQSDVSSIIPTAPPSADCIHHKSPFIYYCETCEQLICNQCTVYGPHNNHVQVEILKITDAYRSRVYYLSEAIRTNLVDKRDKIIAQLHRLEYRVEEIRFVKNIIARDIRSEYSGILERLKSHEGVKLAELSHEVSLAQREVDNINDIGNTFFDLTTMEGDQSTRDRNICKFLLKSKKMYEAIEYILHKPDRPLPDARSDELPQQIEENKVLLQKAVAAKSINDFKNEVIFNLAKQTKQQQKKIKSEVQEKADGMIRNLSDEAQTLNKKLNRFKMVCFYCGIRLNPKLLTQQCQQNKSNQGSVPLNLKVQKSPPENYKGNNRHFFTRLVEEQQK